MQHFLYTGSYTAEAWAELVRAPKDLAEAMRPGIEGFGGKVVACFVSVEKHQAIGFVTFSDNVAAVAWTLWLTKQRGIASAELVPMLTTQEAVAAMKNAGSRDQIQPGW